MSETNGNTKEKDLLGPPKTAGYRPTATAYPAWDASNWGAFNLAIVDDMRRDPQVSLCMSYKQAPLFTAEFEIKAGDQREQSYVAQNLERFWRKSLAIALESDAYGYGGSEALYKEEGGRVTFDALKPLHARDVKPWTARGRLDHVRLIHSYVDQANEQPEGGIILEGATRTKPAKGFWCVHDPKYNHWFGRSLLVAAWWPWRLKSMPDGANETLFKWFYKHAFSGMTVRFPDQEYQTVVGGAREHAQDIARRMANEAKTGANFSLSSSRDEKGNFLWDITNYGGKTEGQAAHLIEYLDFLDKQIQRALLVPDEVLTHEGNTGGYSRSQIAAAAFMLAAEQRLNQVLECFDDQILRPLARMNFGRATYAIKPKPLLMPDQQPGQGQPPQPGQPGQGGQPPQPALFGGQPVQQLSAAAQTQANYQTAPPPVRPKQAAPQKLPATQQPPQGQKPKATMAHFADHAQAAAAGFTHHYTTEKGSQYLVHGGGTSRFKQSAGQGQGAIDRHSSQTHYVHPDQADNVMEIMQDHALDPSYKASIRTVAPGQIGIVVKNRKTGQVDNQRSRLIKTTPHPEVGKSPIEVWDKDPVTGEHGHHVGHTITKISPLAVKLSTGPWDESKVHRGQPENAGEFAKGEGAMEGETPEDEDARQDRESAEHEAKYDQLHAVWEGREKDRAVKREALASLNTHTFAEPGSVDLSRMDPDLPVNSQDQEAAQKWAEATVQHFRDSFQGRLAAQLETLGGDDKGKVKRLAERGTDAVQKAADRYLQAAAKQAEAFAALPADLPEPEEEGPEHDRWQKHQDRAEVLQDREALAAEKAMDLKDKIDEVYEAVAEKIQEELDEIQESLSEAIDQDAEDDPEPDYDEWWKGFGQQGTRMSTWSPYEGPRGGKGWQNEAGDVVYGDKPGSDTAPVQAAPAKPSRSPAGLLARAARAPLTGFKAAAGAAHHLEHAAAELVAQVEPAARRLPGVLRVPVLATWKLLRFGTKAAFVTYTAGQAAANAVAKETGMDAEQAANLRRICTRIDLAGAKAIPLTLGAIGLGAIAAQGSFIPLGSACYLAYATARHPVATANAARKAVQRVLGRAQPIQLAFGDNLLRKVAARLDEHKDNADWYQGLLLHAMDYADSLSRALAMADQAVAQTPANPTDGQAQDDQALDEALGTEEEGNAT